MGRAYVIKTDGTEQELAHQPTYKEAVKVVGGYLEYAQVGPGKTMICNEEGLLDKLPVNAKATRLFNEGNLLRVKILGNATIVGDVILLVGWRGTKN